MDNLNTYKQDIVFFTWLNTDEQQSMSILRDFIVEKNGERIDPRIKISIKELNSFLLCWDSDEAYWTAARADPECQQRLNALLFDYYRGLMPVIFDGVTPRRTLSILSIMVDRAEESLPVEAACVVDSMCKLVYQKIGFDAIRNGLTEARRHKMERIVRDTSNSRDYDMRNVIASITAFVDIGLQQLETEFIEFGKAAQQNHLS